MYAIEKFYKENQPTSMVESIKRLEPIKKSESTKKPEIVVRKKTVNWYEP